MECYAVAKGDTFRGPVARNLLTPRRNQIGSKRGVSSTPTKWKTKWKRTSEWIVFREKRGKHLQAHCNELSVAGANVEFQIDTGASVSTMSETAYKNTWNAASRPKVYRSTTVLRTYTGQSIPIKGECEVIVKHGEQSAKVRLLIVHGSGPNLMGRDWLEVIRLNWAELHNVSMTTKLTRLLEENDELFSPGLGELKGTKVQLDLNSDATPRFVKARPVPFALKAKVENVIDRLVNEGILEPVQFSKWAAPIVPVVKKNDGSVRICGDYKITVNQATKGDAHTPFRASTNFSRNYQVESVLETGFEPRISTVGTRENSREYVTINTHRGLFRYTRLPFGITTAPAIFQRTLESLLAGIPGVIVYLDDILVTGDTIDNHLANWFQLNMLKSNWNL